MLGPDAASPLREAHRPRSRSKARRGRHGFTLVELMVAIATGLTVGLAAFLLAKVSLGAFQQDARVNNAQHAVLMAMNRITADVKRAGFMTTPNASVDDNICERSSLPATQASLLVAADVYEGKPGSGNFDNVEAYGTAPNRALPAVVTGAENQRMPDRLRLTGNYMTTERIRYRFVESASNIVTIAIETNAVQRIYRDSPPGSGSTICRMFPDGRIMRLVDGKKKDTYVRIANNGCTESEAGGYLTSATVAFAPLGAAVPNVPGVCGVRNGNEAGTMNTVNIIEYSLQQVQSPFDAPELAVHGLPPSAASLVRWDNGTLAATTGEDTRMDLLRRELDASGNIIQGTGEVVAEWAADFKLSLWFAPSAGSTALVNSGFDKDDANPPSEPPPPQRIRAIGVRLTTRSREPDRQVRTAGVPDPTDPLDRFEVFPTAVIRKNRLARVRTMYTEVSLPNLAGVMW